MAPPSRYAPEIPHSYEPESDSHRVFGLPNRLHFWSSGTSPIGPITDIYSRDKHGLEDVVWHAWGEILRIYLPAVVPTKREPFWTIEREAYRGPRNASPSGKKPDIVAVLWDPIPHTRQGVIPRFHRRDFLWIECKKAGDDTPAGWCNAIGQVTNNLELSMEGRMVFVLIAVGYKCIYFVWNPAHNQQKPLWMHLDNGQRRRFNPSLQNIDGRWVNDQTGEIDPGQALRLDCFTHGLPNQPHLANSADLMAIETFVDVVVRLGSLRGHNPAWSAP